jgi:plasmid replication initiation protein
MKNKLTPERFALHPRHIAQGRYMLGITANRLLKMAIKHFDHKSPKPEVKFSFSEYFEAFEIEHPGAKDKLLLKEAVQELLHASVEILEEYPDGNFGYGGYNFFSHVSAFLTSWGLDRLTVRFTVELAVALAEYKKSGYSLIDIEKFKKLQGKYEMRLYEIAMSHEGQKNDGEWRFEYSIAELREMLKTEKMYEKTAYFREQVIERSIAGINEANIGIHIDVERGKKKMSEKDALRFTCKYNNQRPEYLLPNDPEDEIDPEKQKAVKAEEKKLKLRERYAEDWKKLFAEEKKSYIARSPWLKPETLSPDAEILIAGIADEKLAEQMKNKPKRKRTTTPNI